MAGRRLVDAAKLFNASKSVAQKHIALRSNQFDVYNKTSTLAQAVKNQTDRVTLTAAAAIALSKRFSEEAPSYAKAAAERATGAQHESIPRREAVKGDGQGEGVKEGLEQDHHYDRSQTHTTRTPLPEEELDVEQKGSPRQPLPDGTVPTSGLTLDREDGGQDTFSKRSISEAPKEPLAKDQGARTPQAGEGFQPVESTESTIPLPKEPTASEKPTEAIPSHANDVQLRSNSPQIKKLQEGHDRDVFYARSVESQPVTSSHIRSQIPKHSATKQESDGHVEDTRLNQDVYYSVPKPGTQQSHEVTPQDEVPEGVNTDVFHSRRVARMLGSDPFSRKEHLERRTSGRHPLDDRPVPQVNASPNVPPSEQAQPLESKQSAQSNTSAKEMEDLASRLAQDASSNVAASEVRLSRPLA